MCFQEAIHPGGQAGLKGQIVILWAVSPSQREELFFHHKGTKGLSVMRVRRLHPGRKQRDLCHLAGDSLVVVMDDVHNSMLKAQFYVPGMRRAYRPLWRIFTIRQ